MLQQNIYKLGILWETNLDLRLCSCLLQSLCIKYINILELVWCLILLAYHPNVHMLYWVIMYFGLHVMQSDPSIYFTLVPVIPCVIISGLPAENRRHTLRRLISPVLWDTGYHLFISQHEIRTKTQEWLSETAVSNCLVSAWSPARNSLNSQWLQGTKLPPMCWAFEVLALESAQRVRCHTALQNPHMPPRSKVDQKPPPKKTETDSRWCEKHSAFCYLPAAAKVWKCVSLRRMALFGRRS